MPFKRTSSKLVTYASLMMLQMRKMYIFLCLCAALVRMAGTQNDTIHGTLTVTLPYAVDLTSQMEQEDLIEAQLHR